MLPRSVISNFTNMVFATASAEMHEELTSWASGMASGPGCVLPVVIVKWQRPSDARRTLPLPKVKLPSRSGADPVVCSPDVEAAEQMRRAVQPYALASARMCDLQVSGKRHWCLGANGLSSSLHPFSLDPLTAERTGSGKVTKVRVAAGRRMMALAAEAGLRGRI